MSFKITIISGDLTEETSDAIVNPANGMMVMGGGVAKAIIEKGGDSIENEAKKSVPLKPGMAVVTHAGNLKTKFVIHAVTMDSNHVATESTVRKATYYALLVAEANKIKSVSFPAMGMGIGGLSKEIVAQSMLEMMRKFSGESSFIEEVKIVLSNPNDIGFFQSNLENIIGAK